MEFRLGSDGATELTEDAGPRPAPPVHRGRRASPIGSAATRSASSTSRASRTWRPRPTSPRACSTTPTGRRSAHRETGAELYAGPAAAPLQRGRRGLGGRRASSRTGSGRRSASTRRRRSTTSAGARRTATTTSGSSRSPGAVPPAHLVGGYAGAVSERQPPVYFGLGGGTIKGVSRPGEIVWSRVFIMDGALHADLGRGHGRRAAGRGDGAALAGDDAAVADHARGPARRDAATR